MKNIRNIVAIALVTAALSACGGGSSEQKTIGGSVDTMNSVEGSNAGNETTGSPMTNDTTANQNGKSTGDNGTNKDSTSNTEGNAKPDGRPQQQ